VRLPYFPGCTLHSKAQNFDASARAAARALGILMEELPEWTCCGATFPMAADSAIGLAAPTRILASAKEAGKLLTLCSFCYNTLKRTNRVIATDAEQRRKVTTFIEEDYGGNVRTVHLLEVLRDDIGFATLAQRVTKPLKGLTVAPYYGCLLLRPAAEMAFDDAERPTILENFLAGLGCAVVDFPHRTERCGSFVAVSAPDVAQACSAQILDAAAAQSAEWSIRVPACRNGLGSRARRRHWCSERGVQTDSFRTPDGAFLLDGQTTRRAQGPDHPEGAGNPALRGLQHLPGGLSAGGASAPSPPPSTR